MLLVITTLKQTTDGSYIGILDRPCDVQDFSDFFSWCHCHTVIRIIILKYKYSLLFQLSGGTNSQ